MALSLLFSNWSTRKVRLIDLKVQTFKVKTSGEKIYSERNGSTMKRFFHQ